MVCGGRTLGPKSAIATASHAKRPRAPVLRHFGRQGLSPNAMKLRELIPKAEVQRVLGDLEIEVSGLAYDSRRINRGDVFFSTARDQEQERANIQHALKRGARALVVRRWADEDARSAATIIETSRPRRLMGFVASEFFNAPSRRLDLIGITGTSGKTTSSYLLAAIFEAAGLSSGIIGTVGSFVGSRKLYSGLTTPASLDFEPALATMEQAGVRAVTAEISSLGMEVRRV